MYEDIVALPSILKNDVCYAVLVIRKLSTDGCSAYKLEPVIVSGMAAWLYYSWNNVNVLPSLDTSADTMVGYGDLFIRRCADQIDRKEAL